MLAMAEEFKAKRSSNVSPRKNLITSMIQVIIMIILALSILTFTLSLMLLLPERDNTSDYSKQVAVKFNAFVCLVVPLVVAYCTQSTIVSFMTQKWISLRLLPYNGSSLIDFTSGGWTMNTAT